MSEWLKRVRAAVGMGLSWAVAWVPVGVLVGWVFGGNGVTPDGFPLDDWVVPFAAFGFLGGATFSAVLRIADGRRRFEELSTGRFGAWGALGGLIAGGLMVLMWQFDAGWGPVLWDRAALLVGSATLMNAASASGSLALARRAAIAGSLEAGEESGPDELVDEQAKALIAGT